MTRGVDTGRGLRQYTAEQNEFHPGRRLKWEPGGKRLNWLVRCAALNAWHRSRLDNTVVRATQKNPSMLKLALVGGSARLASYRRIAPRLGAARFTAVVEPHADVAREVAEALGTEFWSTGVERLL